MDHPDSTGFMLNWTLALYGEQDPEFLGTPIHYSSGIHQDEEHELPETSTTTHTTISDSTPPRPTPNKVSKTTTKSSSTSTTKKTTTQSASSSSSSDSSTSKTTEEASTTTSEVTSSTEKSSNDTENPESSSSIQSDTVDDETIEETSGYLTIVYSVLGSVAILGVASAIFLYKKGRWQSASVSETFTNDRRPDGYEFDVLQPLTELDEEESDDEEEDRRPLNH